MPDPMDDLLYHHRGCLAEGQFGSCTCGCDEALDHYRNVLSLAQGLRERAMNAELERDRLLRLEEKRMMVDQSEALCAVEEQAASLSWEIALNAAQDEHAKTIVMLQKAVGNCSLTEYQPEADLEIATRIHAIKAERDRLRQSRIEALEIIKLSARYSSRLRKALERIATDYDCDPRAEARHALEEGR